MSMRRSGESHHPDRAHLAERPLVELVGVQSIEFPYLSVATRYRLEPSIIQPLEPTHV